MGEFRSRWSAIQTAFVDEPRKTVEQADELVAEIMQRLAQSFSDQRSNLERQWERSDQISTEDLRLALRRYRSFFDRLLSI
jgi:inorganic triphosphatase YgiF